MQLFSITISAERFLASPPLLQLTGRPDASVPPFPDRAQAGKLTRQIVAALLVADPHFPDGLTVAHLADNIRDLVSLARSLPWQCRWPAMTS